MKKLISSVFAIFVMFCSQALCMVDTVNRISQGEKNFVANRKNLVDQAIFSLAGINDPQNYPVIPKMAFCFSGGGYRAMIASAAFCQAATEIGLWDATTYLTALSGSTWFLGSCLMRDCLMSGGLSFPSFAQKLNERVVGVDFFDPKTLHWATIISKLMFIHDKTGSIQPADIWGAILADRLLSDLRGQGQEINFSRIQTFLQENPLKYPYPIFTASLVSSIAYHWLEVNPYAAGGDMLMNGDRNSYRAAYIPSTQLGSVFNAGGVVKQNPEMTYAGLMGICGSPYSLSLWDIVKFALQQINAHTTNKTAKVIEGALEAWLIKCLDLEWMNSLRFLPTNINNFTAGMPGAFFGSVQDIWVSDAGEINNLPFTPLLDPVKTEGVARNINVIVVCDASSDAGDGDKAEMHVARNQVYRLGLWGCLPEIRHCTTINDNLYVFKDPSRPYVPTIIYFSLPRSAHVRTLLFDYTSEQFDNVYNSMHDLVVAGRQTIVNEVNEKANKLNKSGWSCSIT